MSSRGRRQALISAGLSAPDQVKGIITPVAVASGAVANLGGDVDRLGVTQRPPLRTTLPATAIDGQELYLQAWADAGVIWHLRYRAFNADGTPNANAYKWEYVGGPPLFSAYDGAVTASLTLNTWGGLGADPALIVPCTGEYLVRHGCTLVEPTTANVTFYLGVKNGATEPTITVNTVHTFQATNTAGEFIAQERQLTVVAGQTITQRYYKNVATGNVSRYGASLAVTPIRVG